MTRAVQMDFQIGQEDPLRHSLRSRLMIGRNVPSQGPVGSTVHGGQPGQRAPRADGQRLPRPRCAKLDTDLDTFIEHAGDQRQGRRQSPEPGATRREVAGITNPAQYDTNGDGYIDDYDFFLGQYDADRIDGVLTARRNWAPRATWCGGVAAD